LKTVFSFYFLHKILALGNKKYNYFTFVKYVNISLHMTLKIREISVRIVVFYILFV
jgi:hypothetical protein